ncbi:MAG: amidase family protein, partial [Chloroflexi bacterium]|nr:amidase family protein [Chloroflexota bacterium]
MTPSDIAFLSATDTAKAIRSLELSPVDAVHAYLERIDRLDTRLAAYITVVREEALDAAQTVADRLRNGEDPGPLAGVPIAVKDQYWTKGILTTNGSKVYKDFIPNE